MYQPKYVKRIIYSEELINQQIQKAADWLNNKFKNIKTTPILICNLKGAIVFYSELLKRLEFNCLLDFTTMSTYRGYIQDITMLQKSIITNLGYEITGKDVILIEDISDTANTLSILIQDIKNRQPKSFTTVVLVDKPISRVKPFVPDFACFTIKEDVWVVGYGMDCNDVGRNLPYIGEYDKNYQN